MESPGRIQRTDGIDRFRLDLDYLGGDCNRMGMRLLLDGRFRGGNSVVVHNDRSRLYLATASIRRAGHGVKLFQQRGGLKNRVGSSRIMLRDPARNRYRVAED